MTIIKPYLQNLETENICVALILKHSIKLYQNRYGLQFEFSPSLTPKVMLHQWPSIPWFSWWMWSYIRVLSKCFIDQWSYTSMSLNQFHCYIYNSYIVLPSWICNIMSLQTMWTTNNQANRKYSRKFYMINLNFLFFFSIRDEFSEHFVFRCLLNFYTKLIFFFFFNYLLR